MDIAVLAQNATAALTPFLPDVVAAPDDMDVQAVLRVQIKKLLTQNQELAREIAQSLDEGRQPSVTVVVSGERAFGNAGDISGSTIITGDHPKT